MSPGSENHPGYCDVLVNADCPGMLPDNNNVFSNLRNVVEAETTRGKTMLSDEELTELMNQSDIRAVPDLVAC